MTNLPRDPHDELASRIADGADVTLSPAESPSSDPVLDKLRVIATLASLNRSTPSDSPRANEGPEQWAGLVLHEKIGEGRFGAVYRAWEKRLDRQVALKLLHAPASSDLSNPETVIQEARQLARVKHRNVLTVHGAESIDGRTGIWTEFVEGQTLERELNQRSRFTPADVISIGIDTCGALSAVHAAGLTHRDVKAQNVMREVGGRVVLMDFGTVHDTGLVPEGGVPLAGTPLYLAPELFAGGTPSVKTDIYALGVMLYRLLTGEYPVTGATIGEIEQQHKVERRPLTSAPDVPVRLARVIERALSRDPSHRFTGADAFADALRAARTGARNGVVVAVAIAVAVGGLAWAAWFWNASRSQGGAQAVAAVAGGSQKIRETPSQVDNQATPQPTAARDVAPSRLPPGGRKAPRDVPTTICVNCIDDNLPSMSGDGNFVVIKDQLTGDLLLNDVRTSTSRRLWVKKETWVDSPDYATNPALSRDGQWVAYLWTARSEGHEELRVRSTLGSNTTPFAITVADGTRMIPRDWRPDNGAVLVSINRPSGRDLAWITVPGSREAGGAVTIVPRPHELLSYPVPKARVSPDGSRIVYAATVSAKEHHLFVMDADGGNHRALVSTAAVNGNPVWSADGARVLFTSDITGTYDLHWVNVTDPPASPEPLRKNIGQGPVGLVVTSQDRYLYAIFPPADEYSFIAPVPDGAGPRPLDSLKPVNGYDVRWSRDGRQLAYFRTRPPLDQNVLLVRDTGDPREHQFTLPDLRPSQPLWMLDGSILVEVGPKGQHSSLYRVDPRTGEFSEILAPPSTGVRSAVAALSPDDSTLYVAAGDLDGKHNRVVAIDLKAKTETQLAPLPDGSLINIGAIGFAANPNGGELAVFLAFDKTRGLIQIIDLKTRSVRDPVGPFSAGAGGYGKINWTADGTIWFMASTPEIPSQGTRIMRVASSGGLASEVFPFIAGLTGSERFSVSPNGSLIVFSPWPGVPQPFTKLGGPRSELFSLDLREFLPVKK